MRLGANSVAAGGDVLVQVRNAYDESVQGATVERGGESVGTTDASGELRVSVPEVGEFDVVASQNDISSEPAVVEGIDRAPDATEETTTTTTGTTEESDPLPGFGPVVALVAAALAVAALRRRR
jgi:hypothetical protein